MFDSVLRSDGNLRAKRLFHFSMLSIKKKNNKESEMSRKDVAHNDHMQGFLLVVGQLAEFRFNALENILANDRCG